MRHRKLQRILAVTLLAGAASVGSATAAFGQGMGSGMMGSGGYVMGSGMMGGSGSGYGPGSGTMGGNVGGYGPGYGAGPGATRSYDGGDYDQLDLSAAQRAKIDAIQQRFARERAALEGAMRNDQDRLQAFYASPNADDATARGIYQALSDTRNKLFEESLDTHRRINAVLTPRQRDQLARARAANRSSLDQ